MVKVSINDFDTISNDKLIWVINLNKFVLIVGICYLENCYNRGEYQNWLKE